MASSHAKCILCSLNHKLRIQILKIIIFGARATILTSIVALYFIELRHFKYHKKVPHYITPFASTGISQEV